MTAPNILFILIDDMGHADLGCTGSTFYDTPRLDKLASEGARGRHAYCAAPVCSPTRASMMTGKYPARMGLTNYFGTGPEVGRVRGAACGDRLPLSEVSIASALRAAGYATWHVGKWHLGPEETAPQHHGFDVNIAGTSWGHPKAGFFSPWKIPGYPDTTSGEYLTDRMTDEACKLIDAHVASKSGKPFYLNLWHYAVHTPIQAPADLVERYKAKARRMGLDQINPIVPGDVMEADHCHGTRIQRRMIQSDPTYAAMVSNLDTNIGRLLDTLEAHGLTENTIVVFTSDNGGLSTAEGAPTSNVPLREGKGWLEEGGLRVPMIFRWPAKVAPGTVFDDPITTPDFYPTFLEAAGLEQKPTQHIDGTSLLPLLVDRKSLDRDAIFWHFPHYANQGGVPCAAVRVGPHKLIRNFASHADSLYDLESDPSESIDLAQRQPDLCAALSSRLTQWLASVGATLPTPA
jgi:arylsulfatase A-like enzyme